MGRLTFRIGTARALEPRRRRGRMAACAEDRELSRTQPGQGAADAVLAAAQWRVIERWRGAAGSKRPPATLLVAAGAEVRSAAGAGADGSGVSAIVGLLLESGLMFPDEVDRFLDSRNADLGYARPLVLLQRGHYQQVRCAAKLALARLSGPGVAQAGSIRCDATCQASLPVNASMIGCVPVPALIALTEA